MTKKLWLWVTCGLVATSLLACQATNRQKVSQTKGGPSWSESMKGLGESVRQLVPFIYVRDGFSDQSQHGKIRSALQRLRQESQEMHPELGEAFMGKDPILALSVNRMNGDLERAQEAFDMGLYEYSRSTMKSVMGTCFACHTATERGARPGWKWEDVSIHGLRPLEKSDLMVAMRDFDGASAYLRHLLNDPEFVQNRPFDFESALRKYLSVMVRVKKQPDEALTEINKVLERDGVPFFLQQQAEGWRRSLERWSREMARGPVRTPPLTQVDERLRQARQIQRYARDHAGDVEYLRATQILHDFVTSNPPAPQLAQAFYALGQSYEALDNVGFWNLHETYYEACVRALPKSDVARSCFNRLQASVFMGYSGSGGILVPPSERQRLQELSELVK